MPDILFDYEMLPTTWFYLSSLMTLGIFFKFHRLWSLRNLDLVGLLALAPGLLLISQGLVLITQSAEQLRLAPTLEQVRVLQELGQQGETLERLGYGWLFVVGAFFLVRLLLDPIMVRRPLLEPNLNASGLTFTCAALFVFFMANVITNRAQQQGAVSQSQGSQAQRQDAIAQPQDPRGLRLEQKLARRDAAAQDAAASRRSPGYPAFQQLAARSSQDVAPLAGRPEEEKRSEVFQVTLVRAMAILGHLAVIIGLVWIGYRHFDNYHTGIGAATLYLLLFYTSQMTGRVDHVIPAALMVWAVASYRRPLVSGLFLATAIGLTFYPVFLLPLWFGYYWRRGAVRFGIGLAAILVLVLLLLAFGPNPFWGELKEVVGATSLSLDSADGFWRPGLQAYRIPVIAAFLALSLSLAMWPAQKHLGTLLSCSAAVMLGAQFWQAHQGGLYMGWYLPLLVLTVFRPNLEDRVALTAVREGWRWRRRK